MRAGGRRSCRAGGFLCSLQSPLAAFAFCGLSFPEAVVVLFQQPFPGECLTGSEMPGFELGLYYEFTELLALAANVFAAVCRQSGSPAL